LENNRFEIVKKNVIAGFCKYWLFFTAFILMAVYLKQSGPMNNVSGDAASIWETIKSIPSGNIVPSYVLYKGFASVYPYVWFYQLSGFFGVGEFFFVKLFHSALFAYVSAIGFPYIAERLLHIKTPKWRSAIFILLVFWLWEPNCAFSQLMVDLPSLTYFILLVNSTLKIADCDNKKTFLRYVYTGLLIGLNTCLSGQYSAAAVCVFIYIIIKMFPKNVFSKKSQIVRTILLVFLVIAGIIVMRSCNHYFEVTVTDSLRAAGAWIPKGEVWLSIGFMRLLGLYNTMIPDYRGLSIVKDLYKDQYELVYQSMIGGSFPLTIGQYFNLVFQYPIDFLMRYINRFFLALSPDGGSLNVLRLFPAYTSLYLVFISVKTRCKTIKQFFSPEILLILGFICSLAAVILLSVEQRYAMQIQGLIFVVAISDDTLWHGLNKFKSWICQCFKEKSIRSLSQKPFPYVFCFYLLFILFCFAHIASMYELLGINANYVLFHL